jgi:hypothetical protein
MDALLPDPDDPDEVDADVPAEPADPDVVVLDVLLFDDELHAAARMPTAPITAAARSAPLARALTSETFTTT